MKGVLQSSKLIL